MRFDAAVDKKIEKCIQEGVLIEFLKENMAETRKVVLLVFLKNYLEKMILSERCK